MVVDPASATLVGVVCLDHIAIARNCGFSVKLPPPLSGSDKNVTLPAAYRIPVVDERA